MTRVLIIGSSGAGKSTFARRLGERTGLEVIHLDRLYWRPSWTEPSKEEWKGIVTDALARDNWIMDGNYGGTMEMRLAACDTVIFLDMPRWLCVYRVIMRSTIYRKTTRPDMADDCEERFDWDFVKWVWQYPARSKPKIEKLLSALPPSTKVIRLSSTARIERFLSTLPENGSYAMAKR